MLILIVAGGLNWWFYRSKYGAVIVILALLQIVGGDKLIIPFC